MCELNDMDYDEGEAYDEDNVYWTNYGTPEASKKTLGIAQLTFKFPLT